MQFHPLFKHASSDIAIQLFQKTANKVIQEYTSNKTKQNKKDAK